MLATMNQFHALKNTTARALCDVREVARQTACRILHGHVMVDLGPIGRGQELYQCARCERVEVLQQLA